MIDLTEQDFVKYKKIAEEIQNSEINELLLSIISKQNTILCGIKKILNKDQSTYIYLFDRYCSILYEIINMNRNENVSKAVLNILQRPAIELSIILHYLLVPGYFFGASEEDERKLKLSLYIYCGYKQKQKEFKKLKDNRFTYNEQYKNLIQENINHYWEKISSSDIYSLCNEKIQKNIKKSNTFFKS